MTGTTANWKTSAQYKKSPAKQKCCLLKTSWIPRSKKEGTKEILKLRNRIEVTALSEKCQNQKQRITIRAQLQKHKSNLKTGFIQVKVTDRFTQKHQALVLVTQLENYPQVEGKQGRGSSGFWRKTQKVKYVSSGEERLRADLISVFGYLQQIFQTQGRDLSYSLRSNGEWQKERVTLERLPLKDN